MGLSDRSSRRLLRLALVILAAMAIGAAGCAGKPKPPPVLTMQIGVAADANPGPTGEPRPIVIRIYELKALGAFSAADFFSLYEQESGTLGAELVTRDEVFLPPGQSRQLQNPLDPQVRYVGVVGAFRDIDSARWRASIPIAAGKDNHFRVAVSGDAITIAPR